VTSREMNSVFISTTPFGEHDREPLAALKRTGWKVRTNNFGRKMTAFEVAEEAADCDGIIAGTEDLGPLIDRNKNIRIIARVGVGLDSVPLKECLRRGIAVSYTPNAVTPAVAEFTIGAMLTSCRHIARTDRALRNKQWQRHFGIRIGSSCIGIVGFGRIGSRVARTLTAFRPKDILVHDILDKSMEISELRSSGVSVRTATLEEILEKSDIISLHVPMTARTRDMFDSKNIAKMKKGSYLINTARGGIVNESALYEALQIGDLAGAAIDVFECEPYTGMLRQLENALVTAHIASCSIDCRAQMECEAAEDLIRYLSGSPLQSPVPLYEYENQGHG
jgi:D-3-phosphoglycerate dehydrogenase